MKNVMLSPTNPVNRLGVAGSATKGTGETGDFNVTVESVLKEIGSLSPAVKSSRQIDPERLAQIIRFLDAQMRFNESLFRIMREIGGREETDGQIKTGIDSSTLYGLAAALRDGNAVRGEGILENYRRLYWTRTRETSIENRLAGLERRIEEQRRETLTPNTATGTPGDDSVRRKPAAEKSVPSMRGEGESVQRSQDAYRTAGERALSVKGKAVASPYADIIYHASETYDVDPTLIRAVIRAESGYRQDSTSPKGAMGLMQLMPETARELGVKNPYDPAENIMGGTRYLKSLLDRFGNNRNLALAAYNWGMGNVEKHPGKLPQETRTYIARVNQYYRETKV
jgi:hypothetical protein